MSAFTVEKRPGQKALWSEKWHNIYHDPAYSRDATKEESALMKLMVAKHDTVADRNRLRELING